MSFSLRSTWSPLSAGTVFMVLAMQGIRPGLGRSIFSWSSAIGAAVTVQLVQPITTAGTGCRPSWRGFRLRSVRLDPGHAHHAPAAPVIHRHSGGYLIANGVSEGPLLGPFSGYPPPGPKRQPPVIYKPDVGHDRSDGVLDRRGVRSRTRRGDRFTDSRRRRSGSWRHRRPSA